MRKRLNALPITALVLAFPIAALADLSKTLTLADNMALSLDTGTTSTTASAGDIYWNGTSMTPEGGATLQNYLPSGTGAGATVFASLTQSQLTSIPTPYTKTPIPGTTLNADDIFFVHTNSGNYSAVLVTTKNSIDSSLSIKFMTFGSSTTGGGPVITLIENNYGEVPPGFANSGVAPGALFFIVGTGLASATPPIALQSPAVGLPSSLNGATVKVTSNNVTTQPAFYYASPTALGLVMPSNTPLGNAQVVVSFNGQNSAPFGINVVQNAFGIDAYFGAGTGMAVAVFTNPNAIPPGGGCAQQGIACYTLSIPPGTQIELYGSGLGADPIRDTTTSYNSINPINALAHIYIGGIDAAISYQGPSGFPGLNQINLTVPANAPLGCSVSLVGVSTTGVPTNFLTLPIGTGTCSDPVYGISGSQIQSLSGQGTVASGTLFVGQQTSGNTVSNVAFGSFQKSTGSNYGSGGGLVSIPGCVVTQTPATSGSTSTITYLDAGQISITGPSGQAVTLTQTPIPGSGTGLYLAQLPAGYIPTSGGTFTFNGTGGVDVGKLTASVVFPNPLLLWTNQAAAATVTRTSGLPITWTGGAPGTYVEMMGSSSSSVASGSFTCIAAVNAGQFTVPAYVLAALPAGTGSVSVGNYTTPQSFSASGVSYGFALGIVSYSVNSTVN